MLWKGNSFLRVPNRRSSITILWYSYSLILNAGLAPAETTSSLPTKQSQQITTTDDSEIVLGLISWLDNNGGLFNPKQEFKYTPEDSFDGADTSLSSPNQVGGIFAREFIIEGEIVAKIPVDLFLGPLAAEDIEDEWENEEDEDDGEEEEETPKFCGLVKNVANEMNKGSDSTHAPYILYLSSWLRSETAPKIPSAWSNPGKALFNEILGRRAHNDKDDNGNHGFPPHMATELLDTFWFQSCGGNEDLASIAGLVKQKAVDDLMVPVHDLYTHRNGAYSNVMSVYHDNGGIYMIASRDIQVGEQLHISYDKCEDCDPEMVWDLDYGTPEIFRDLGFVERFPQSYHFQPGMVEVKDEEDDSFYYASDYIDFDVVQGDDGVLSVDWADHFQFDDPGRNYVRRIFRKELRRLDRIQNVMIDLESVKPPPSSTFSADTVAIPQQEWDNIKHFFHSIKNAMKLAIQSLVNDDDSGCLETTSVNDGVCPAESIDSHDIHYDDLADEEDNTDYIFPNCTNSQIVEYIEYQDIYDRPTNYQDILFCQREEDDDVCMNLETTLQICASYRPHYHEFFVHYPARYIDTVKRVIFIGGGDAMLLHEVLKYPSLEKVVGLELDQQVTRKSFKYFHSQPHYDKDNVEWWYGDATKSLPLLPKEYWGSFDLVLVDLSETVMSMSVTGELDIFAALSLLLKPDGGVMVKNEPYLEHFSQFFDFTVQVFYGSPKVCTQVLTMGSNAVDFLHHPVKEHADVERLLLEPLADNHIRFKYMHDYLKTDARRQAQCFNNDNNGNGNKDTIVQHGNKAGILEIIDAEGISISLDEEGLLEQKVKNVINELGFSLVSEPVIKEGNFIFVLKEGYIVIRSWPENHYCGIDLNLWGRFEKHDRIREALVEAVGSSTVSSFRIVVGGMHGTGMWEDDKEAIGIQVSQSRNCEEETQSKSDEENASTEAVSSPSTFLLDEALSRLVHSFFSNETVVVVACGTKESSECASLKVLSKHPSIKQVVPIWTCPELLKEDADYTKDYELMYKCESSIIDQLEGMFGGNSADKANAFVLDGSVPYSMGQIFQSLWSVPENYGKWLTPRHFFVAPILENSKPQWRQNFLDRYRKEKHPFPVSRVEIEILGDGSSRKLFSIGVLSSNERHFFNHIQSFEKTFEAAVSSSHGEISVNVPTIHGGVKYFDDEYNSKTFEIDAYDAGPAKLQASAQVSLGRQSVFQFEYSEDTDDDDKADDIDSFLSLLETTIDKLRYEPTKLIPYTDVGEGGVIVSTFADGAGVLILVWDGQSHVDINLFSRDESSRRADNFVKTFTKVSGLQTTLRDDQPRGTGRVVQFQSERGNEAASPLETVMRSRIS